MRTLRELLKLVTVVSLWRLINDEHIALQLVDHVTRTPHADTPPARLRGEVSLGDLALMVVQLKAVPNVHQVHAAVPFSTC